MSSIEKGDLEAMGDARWEVAAQPLPRAAILRRGFAFAIDVLVVGGVVALLGWLMFDAPWMTGAPARACGFAIALVYFGWMNSRLAGGQTVGKRLLKIRTQRVDGSLLSVPRAFARYTVSGAPFFVGGMLPETLMQGATSWLLAIVQLGLLFAIVCLVLFNRRTRRSVHDYAVDSWVVSASAPHA